MSAVEPFEVDVDQEEGLEGPACAGYPADWFFEPGPDGTYDRAREVCRGCDVRERCLEANLGERFGIWGGTDERERRKLRRSRRRALEGRAMS